jgi:hypothetical protein
MIRSMEFHEFYRNYAADIPSFPGCDWDSVGSRISSMQSALIRQLSESGLKEHEHFKVGWDMSERFLVYGAILDLESVTAGLVSRVLQAFSEDEEPAVWACHFVVERDSGPELQFYITANGDITICEEPGWETLRDRLEPPSPSASPE